MKITRTKLALTATCKCGSIVASSLIIGGIEIDAEFMDTVAEIANDGGIIEIVNTDIRPIKMDLCKCKKAELC